MSGPIARILLRVIAGILIGYMVPQHVVNELLSSPDVETILTAIVDASLGLIIWAVTELFYALAKRLGWKT